jgi:hypothetical protein
LNVSARGETARDAGTAATVNVTPIKTGLLDAPGAEIVIVPLYGPTERFAVFAETASTPVAVERAIQDALAEADQVSVPPPLLVIWTDCAAGIVPPNV